MFAVQRQTARSWERKSDKRASGRAYASAQPMLAAQRTSCACGGGCPRCAVQPKLRVGAANDPLEREADRMAAQATRTPHPQVANSVTTGEPAIRRSSDRGSTASIGGPALGLSDLVISGGASLPQPVQAFFESRFGHDFSAVRVHTGEAAAQENERLGARAFTYQNHISLARGEAVAPTELLAHELAHVVQNDGAAPDAIRCKEDWNFTPKDFATLKKSKKDLKMASDSSWVPAKLQENILNTLRYTLDAKRSPSATEGINIDDFYHGHLVVPDNDKGLSIDATDARSAFQKELAKQTTKALGGEYENVTMKNLGAYTKGIKATLPLLGKAMEEVMKIKGAAVMYHTFELTVPSDLAAKKQGLDPSDPRRHYITPFDTNTPKPYKLPKGSDGYLDHYIHYLEFTFLVDENGEVHVRPGGRDSTTTITGKSLTGV